MFKKLLMGLNPGNNYVWEYLYIHNLHLLLLIIKKYQTDQILEIDSVDDVLAFDKEFLINNGKFIKKE